MSDYTVRQAQVCKLLQQELGRIFTMQSSVWFGGALISVVDIHIGKDFSLAKVYLNFISPHNGPQLLEKVTQQSQAIKKRLGQQVARKIHKIPHLQFFQDNSIEQGRRVSALIEEIEDKKN